MKRHLNLFLFILAALLVSMVPACSKEVKNAAGPAASENNPDNPDDGGETVVMGRVTAVNDKEVTISIAGGFNQRDRSRSDRPDRQITPGADAPDNNSRSGKGFQDKNMEKPTQGAVPSTEEEDKTVTIGEDVTITVTEGDGKSEGSMSDITIGSFIELTYVNDEITSVAVRSIPERTDRKENQKS